MKRFTFLFIFLAMAAGIIGFHYYENYKFFTDVPSKSWSKEIKIASCKNDIYNGARVINYKNNHVIAVDDGTSIKIIMMNKKGIVLSRKEINTKADFLYNINLLTDNKRIYINWLTGNLDTKQLHTIALDNSLKAVKETSETDLKEATTIDDNILLKTYGNKIVFIDLKTNKKVQVNENDCKLTSGTKTNKGYFITFYKQDSKEFKYFYIKDGIASVVKIAGIFFKSNDAAIFQTATGADKNNGYILISIKIGPDKKVIKFCFSLNKLEYKTDVLIIEDSTAFNPVNISSGESARFALISLRDNGKKDTLFNVADISFKNGEIEKYEFINNKDRVSNYLYANKEFIAYCDFVNSKNYDVYIQSENEVFKDIHNVVRQSEIDATISETVYDIIASLFTIINFGVIWWLPGLALMGFVFFFGGMWKDKTRRIMLTVAYALMALIKVFYVHDKIYVNYSRIPIDIFPPMAGIAIMLVISTVCCIYGYRKYLSYEKEIPMVTFVYALIIDTLLTQMFFVPFFINS